ALGALLAHGDDDDVGPDGEGLELALVAAVFALRHRSDGSHETTPLAVRRRPIPPPACAELRPAEPEAPKRRLRRAGPERSGGPAAGGLPLRRRLPHRRTIAARDGLPDGEDGEVARRR